MRLLRAINVVMRWFGFVLVVVTDGEEKTTSLRIERAQTFDQRPKWK